MEYLNRAILADLSAAEFRQRRPYPWIDIPCSLTTEGFGRLRTELPDSSRFRRIVFAKGAHEGVGHDRLSLHYQQGMAIGEAWDDFLAELRRPYYGSFIRRMCGVPHQKRLLLTFEWY